jgi:hypothetical protein
MYKGYLKLIYRSLSDDVYIELTYVRTPYREITYVYGKTHVTIM